MSQNPAPSDQLDPLLHQPVRTRLTAFLKARGQTSFRELKQALEVSDGNLDSHMKKLLAADYVTVEKNTGRGRAQSLYALTDKGEAAFVSYVANLQKLLSGD